ncbi:unnamed protein product [Mycena citricolor]|uniref:Uncharacterized protein n=1 Tax=Mycena citricolor TaxID=2018698 RepID=A0AAD2HBS2_9AGAR|nr:unnamed protein product [Mycena citricolor]CAK5272639.1 unnamed protein product [Mycena citricolor]
MPSQHILALIGPAWGHALPYIHLATRMLASDPDLVLTIVQHNILVPKMVKELGSCSYDVNRLKIEGVGDPDMQFSPLAMEGMTKQLTSGWLEFLTKAVAGGSTWPKPRTLHMDFFGGAFVIKESKALLGPEGKILFWNSAGVTACVDTFSKYDYGKTAREIYAEESKRAGRTIEEIIGDVACAANGSDKLDGRALDILGGLKIYDHEHFAQGAGSQRQFAPLMASAQEMAHLVDGFFCPTSSALEPVTAPLSREFYKQRGQELFLVGPQMHDDEWEAPSAGPGPTDERVKTFLDESRKKYGPKSVLYISFGSMFFPLATPHLVEVMIDVLLSLETVIPFVFVLAGAMASLPKETIDRIHASGRGLVCAHWVDQKAILKGGTIGWFLTHGGYNSLTEALSQGIPLLFWPIGAEQAVNAAILSTGPRPIGIELFQVFASCLSEKYPVIHNEKIRAGAQLGPSLRPEAPKITGTVEDARTEFQQAFSDLKGSRGELLGKNAVRVGELWREERINGEPVQEIARLTRF